MLGEIRGEVRFKEPLSFHTSLRIGGPADIFVVPQDVEDIRLAMSYAEREQLAPAELARRLDAVLAATQRAILQIQAIVGAAARRERARREDHG